MNGSCESSAVVAVPWQGPTRRRFAEDMADPLVGSASQSPRLCELSWPHGFAGRRHIRTRVVPFPRACRTRDVHFRIRLGFGHGPMLPFPNAPSVRNVSCSIFCRN